MVGTVPIYESCPNQIEERLHTSQVAHHAGVYYSFCNMERQGMVLLFSFLVFAVFVNFCLVRIDIPRNQKNRKQRTLAPTKLLIHASLSWLYSEANNIFPFTFFTFFFTDFRHIFLHKRALYNVDVNLTPFFQLRSVEIVDIVCVDNSGFWGISLTHYYMKGCLWTCNRTRKPATAIEGHQFDYDCDSIDSFPRSAIIVLVLSQTQTEIASRKKSGFEGKSSTRLNSPEGSEKMIILHFHLPPQLAHIWI